jgi:hypothetical protein
VVLEAVTVVIETNVVVVIVVAMATVVAMVNAAAAPAMATEAEGSVRATPDAPDADVVMAAHGS